MITRLAVTTLQRELQRPFWLVVTVISAVWGILVASWPAGLDGDDTSLGLVGGLGAGAQAIEHLGPWVGFLLAVVVTGADYDTGIAREWHLSGLPSRVRHISSWLVSAALTVVFAISTVTGAGLAGLSDQAARHVTRQTFSTSHVAVGAHAGILLTCLLGVTLGWAIALAVQSSRQALAIFVGLSASLLLGLLLPVGWVRALLVLHPMAGVWVLEYHGRSAVLTLDQSSRMAWLSLSVWSAVTVLAGFLRSRGGWPGAVTSGWVEFRHPFRVLLGNRARASHDIDEPVLQMESAPCGLKAERRDRRDGDVLPQES